MRSILVFVLSLVLLVSPAAVGAQEASPASAPATEDWATFHGNGARTGAAADPGPAGNPELLWRLGTGLATMNASPAVAGGVVYAATGLLGEGTLTAVDLATGRQIWASQLPDNLFASSPAVAGDTVYIAGLQGNVFAVSSVSGELLWQAKLAADTTSSPAVVGDTLFIGADDDRLYALDVASGAERWAFQAGGGGEYTLGPSPAVADGVVFVATPDSDQEASLFAVDAVTGEERWRFEPDSPGLATPAVSDGVVYVGGDGGSLYALDAAGGEALWRTEVGQIASAPAISGGMVYAHTRGQVIALNAADGVEQWRAKVGGLWSSPAVAGGTVYAGGNGLAFEGGLYAIDAASGSMRWQLKEMGSVIASPAIAGDVVIVGADDGAIYAIGGTDATGPGNGSTSAGALVSPITFSTAVDDRGLPVDPSSEFPADTTALYAGFDFLGIAGGAAIHVTWYLDGKLLAERDGVWDLGAAGHASEHISANSGRLPPGEYEVAIQIDGEEVRRGGATVG